MKSNIKIYVLNISYFGWQEKLSEKNLKLSGELIFLFSEET